MSERTVVGVKPWLPWPLSGWPSWTEPVRAERLAALRIGLAAVVFLDVLLTYFPQVHNFYGPDSLSRVGDEDAFAYVSELPHYNWSVLRGFGHPLNLSLALGVGFVATLWLLVGLPSRPDPAGDPNPSGLRWGLVVWTAAAVCALLGVWARLRKIPDWEGPLRLASAAVAWLIATLFLVLEGWRRFRLRGVPGDPLRMVLVLSAWLVTGAFAGLGLWYWREGPLSANDPLSLSWAMGPWDDNPDALSGAMIFYLAATACLLFGLGTRVSAVLVWAMSQSFANINPGTDSNGDVIRGILLFYLVVSPCGAAWSVDGWLARRLGRRRGPVYVYPWALRLLFLQMIVMYFFNGVYKMMGDEWREGTSIYYVLADVTMTRLSFAEFHLPVGLLYVLSWAVLAWELGFPLLIALPWTRRPALVFGALFHVGIWANLELGPFAAYALCFYLPLLPWERWADRWRGEKTATQ
jgi:hypothetical protein